MIRTFPINAVMQRGILNAEAMILGFGSERVDEQKKSSVETVWFLISVKFSIFFSTMIVTTVVFLVKQGRLLYL